MRCAGLPEAFVEMIETGWWTTCLQVLPPFERSLGRFQLYRSELAPGDDHDGLGPGSVNEAPLEQPERPVVALFGTALFPRRLWMLDAAVTGNDLAALRTLATKEGFVEIRTSGAEEESAGNQRIASGGPELTLGSDGWYWDPTMDHHVAGVDVAMGEVKRLVVEQVLTQAQSDGRLPRSYGCVVRGGT